MRKRDKANAERPELNRSTAFDDIELHMPGEPFFLELAGDQPGGERRREERALQLFGKVGKRADMVLMAVGQDDPREPLLLVLDEFEVGKDQLDPGVAGVGEGEPQVDHDPLATAAVEIDVHANLARAAERAEEQ